MSVTPIYTGGGNKFPQEVSNSTLEHPFVMFPEPTSLIRIDWWGHEFQPSDGKNVGGNGKARICVDGVIWEGLAEFKVQGTSSAANAKKNMTMNLKNKEGGKLALQIGGSVASTKWIWKCDYTDASKLSNPLSYKLYMAIINSRETMPKNDVDRWWFGDTRDVPKGMPTGAVGVPPIHAAVMYHNDEFYGIGNILIKQDLVNMNVFNETNTISFEYDGRKGGSYASGSAGWQNLYAESPSVLDLYPEEWTPARINAVNGLGDLIRDTSANNLQNFRDNWANHLYSLDNLIDHYLYTEWLYDYDGLRQDINIVSYDCQRFFLIPWDKDTAFGVPWNDGSIKDPTLLLIDGHTTEQFRRFFSKIKHADLARTKARYAELRDLGLFSVGWLYDEGVKHLSKYGKDLIEEEYVKWPGTFAIENNLNRLLSWVETRQAVLDAHFDYTP